MTQGRVLRKENPRVSNTFKLKLEKCFLRTFIEFECVGKENIFFCIFSVRKQVGLK